MAVKKLKAGTVPQSIGSWIQPKAVTAKTVNTGAWPSMQSALKPPPQNVLSTPEGLFAPGDQPGGFNDPAIDPTGLDPTNPGAPWAGPTPGNPGVDATPTLPPAPTSRTIPAHWFTPDWEALLHGDPRFIAGQGSLAAGKSFAASRRATAIKNAIIAFGATPKGWQSGYGDLNETDIAQAGQNPYSFVALANAQRGRSRADLQAELAGRGILSSGALTGGENMIQSAYDQGYGQQENTLLGQLSGAESGYGSDILGLDQGWIDTQAQIGAGVQAANPAQWIDQYEEPV